MALDIALSRPGWYGAGVKIGKVILLVVAIVAGYFASPPFAGAFVPSGSSSAVKKAYLTIYGPCFKLAASWPGYLNYLTSSAELVHHIKTRNSP